MFDGTTLIVDVETLGENSFALSLPAEDLWVAYEVVRRHVDANGVRHFSQMVEAKTTSDGYSFKFDTGDTFTCASHLDKPTSSTLSGSVLPPITAADNGKVLTANSGVWGAQEPIGKKFIVTLTIDNTEPIQGTMDKSIGEIEAAYNAGRRVEFELQTEDNLFIMPLQYVSVNGEIWSAYFSAITDAAMLFSGYTSGTSDKTSTDFGIDVYTLTPAT